MCFYSSYNRTITIFNAKTHQSSPIFILCLSIITLFACQFLQENKAQSDLKSSLLFGYTKKILKKLEIRYLKGKLNKQKLLSKFFLGTKKDKTRKFIYRRGR